MKEYYSRPEVQEEKLAYEKERKKLPEVQERHRISQRRRYHDNLEESRKKGRTTQKASYARKKAARGSRIILPIQELIKHQVVLPQEYSEDKPHYTYVLKYPEDYPEQEKAGTVFYVGKGKEERIHDHEKEAKKGIENYKCHAIRLIWAQGRQIVKEILACFETHKEALQYEIALIFFMDGLVNLTDGGEGVIGHKHSEESKRKISKKQKDVPKGPPSMEHRENISKAKKGKPSPLKGRKKKPHTEETKRQISESKKGSIPWNKGKKGQTAWNKGKRGSIPWNRGKSKRALPQNIIQPPLW
jgi:hypothetical protein